MPSLRPALAVAAAARPSESAGRASGHAPARRSSASWVGRQRCTCGAGTAPTPPCPTPCTWRSARPAWPADPLAARSPPPLDVPLPDGRTMRPASVRLRPTARRRGCARSRSAERRPRLRSPGSAAVARLAAADRVAPGSSRRAVRTERDLLVARWLARRRRRPSTTPLAALAAAMPPICLPDADDPTTVADIHAAMVDAVARHRLADARLAPDCPTGRDAGAVGGTRRVPRAGLDPIR